MEALNVQMHTYKVLLVAMLLMESVFVSVVTIYIKEFVLVS